MSANDVAVSLGRYKDKTIAELAEALGALEWLPEAEGEWAECPCCGATKMNGHIHDGCQLSMALARARTDPSWQRYSRDNQEPLDLAE